MNVQVEKKGSLLWTIWCWIVGGIITILSGATAILASMITGSEESVHRVAHYWGRMCCLSARVKLSIHGLENIDTKAPYVFASNHQGHFDILAINAILPMEFRWVSKKEYFMVPFMGWAMTRAGYISTDRYNVRKAALSLRQGLNHLKNNVSVIIFPEATRTRDRHLLPYLDGAFALAIKAQVPVVPIVLVGSMDVISINTLRTKPGHIRVFVGEPIPTEGLKNKDRELLSIKVKEAMCDIYYRETGLERPKYPVVHVK